MSISKLTDHSGPIQTGEKIYQATIAVYYLPKPHNPYRHSRFVFC